MLIRLRRKITVKEAQEILAREEKLFERCRALALPTVNESGHKVLAKRTEWPEFRGELYFFENRPREVGA
jgi:hypothetical protein